MVTGLNHNGARQVLLGACSRTGYTCFKSGSPAKIHHLNVRNKIRRQADYLFRQTFVLKTIKRGAYIHRAYIILLLADQQMLVQMTS